MDSSSPNLALNLPNIDRRPSAASTLHSPDIDPAGTTDRLTSNPMPAGSSAFSWMQSRKKDRASASASAAAGAATIVASKPNSRNGGGPLDRLPPHRRRLFLILGIAAVTALLLVVIVVPIVVTRNKSNNSSNGQSSGQGGSGGSGGTTSTTSPTSRPKLPSTFAEPLDVSVSRLARPAFPAVANHTFTTTNVGTYRLAKGDGGNTGAAAIHIGLLRDTSKVLILDRWDVKGTMANMSDGNPAWATEYDYTTDEFRTLKLVSNVFCGGGMLLPDGRMMVVGGSEAFSGLGGIQDGMKSIRLMASSGAPGSFGSEPLVDDPSNPRLQMASKRWYPSVVALPDGRNLIIGGSTFGVSFLLPINNTGTMEILPPHDNAPQDALIPLQFLWDTLPANLYPTTALLPSGRIFVTASDRATVLDPATGYRAVRTFLVQGRGNTCMGFAPNTAFGPIPGAAPLSTTVGASTTTSRVVDGQVPTPSSTAGDPTTPTSLPIVTATSTSSPPPPGAALYTAGTRIPLSACLPSTRFDQNRTADSEQTFAFFATREPQYYRTDPGAGWLVHTASKRCASFEAGGSVVLRDCVRDAASMEVRIVSADGGGSRMVVPGGCLDLDATRQTVGVASCTSETTRLSLIDTSVYFEYPKLPGGPYRSYPLTGFGLLLPLDPVDNYDPAVMVCGGSRAIDPTQDFRDSPANLGLRSCGIIRPERPDAAWEMEDMPTPRTLADLVHLPDGTVLLLNGAQRGMAGWDLGREPNYAAHLFLPHLPRGQRWRILANSTVPRLYHSVAQLLPDGRVMVAGSAPNSPTDPFWGRSFETEYRVEYYLPHYLSLDASRFPRPEVTVVPTLPWRYNVTYGLTVKLDASPSVAAGATLRFNILQTGFRTHSTSFSQRLVWLRQVEIPQADVDKWVRDGGEVTVAVGSPERDTLAPPGWYLVHAVLNGVPSRGVWVQVGGDPAGVAEYWNV
ncbi:hypothetical protein HDU96_007992 [Phlyctochytrium bullatum]|nr:hypothetical protein HDU96_007992 [Phlyctochytrium bullatum]